MNQTVRGTCFVAAVGALSTLACISAGACGETRAPDTVADENLGANVAPVVLFGTQSTAQLGVDVVRSSPAGHDRVVVTKLVAGGRDWQVANPSPLFEAAVGPCVWNSGAANSTTTMTASPVGGGSSITASLGGCQGVPPLTLHVNVTASSGHVDISGTAGVGVLLGTAPNGWFGPFALGDVVKGSQPVFAPAAHVAAVRSRVGSVIGNAGGEPLREDAFVIGFDGIIYGSLEDGDGAWSVPSALYDPTDATGQRVLFTSGAPLAALRRTDVQTDVFGVVAGPNGGKLATIFRVGEQAWSPPMLLVPTSTATLAPDAPIAALSLNEEFDTHINEEEVYVAGTGGSIFAYHMADDGGWTEQQIIVPPAPNSPCAVPASAHVAALLRNYRQRDIFYIDQNGSMCTAFKIRTGDAPPDASTKWSTPIPLSPTGMFPPGGALAAAHGPANGEFVFASATNGVVFSLSEVDDGAWGNPISISGQLHASPTGDISAVRRTAREIVVAFVDTSGNVVETRTSNGVFQPTVVLPSFNGANIVSRKIALSFRKPEQVDVFGIAGDGDNRFWTSADGNGRIELRLVMPKFLFLADGGLAQAKGMIPMEMGGDTTLKNFDCSPHPDAGFPQDSHGCELGMPYFTDPHAQDIAVPQSMNIMDLLHVTQGAASFFVADISRNIENGQGSAQISAHASEVDGFWTKELWPGQTTTLPTLRIGGYASPDWHPAVDAYNDAGAQAANIGIDTPAWLRRAGAIYTFGGGGAGGIYLDLPNDTRMGSPDPLSAYADAVGVSTFQSLLPIMQQQANSVGSNVVYLWDYWAEDGTCAQHPLDADSGITIPYFCKGDYRIDPTAHFGGLASLQAGIAAVHTANGKVILYIEPYVLGLGADVTNRFGVLFQARSSTNSGTTAWLPFGDNPIPLSYAHSSWQDRFVQLAKQLVSDTGADGLFLDSGAWRINARAETKDEGVRATPIEHARGFLNLADRVRSAIRQLPHHADAVVLSETISGPMTRHIDGAVSSDFAPSLPTGGDLAATFDQSGNPVNPVLRATPTRYGSPVTNIFSNGTNINQLNQVYAAGHNLALTRTGFMVPNASYIQRLVQKRILYADALVEGAQSDLAPSTPTPDFIARLYRPSSASPAAITVVNVGSAPVIGRINVSGVSGSGTTFCDIIAKTQYVASIAGTIDVDVPTVSTTGACPVTGACGLRVLVRETCSAETAKE